MAAAVAVPNVDCGPMASGARQNTIDYSGMGSESEWAGFTSFGSRVACFSFYRVGATVGYAATAGDS